MTVVDWRTGRRARHGAPTGRERRLQNRVPAPPTLPGAEPLAPLFSRPSARRRLGDWLRAHRAGVTAVAVVLMVSGVTQALGMYGAPQRADDEGTYVAQAWAVLHWHTLAHYTYWYDHPPLGWMVMAAWFGLTGGISHAPSAVDAGRQFMVVVQEVSAVLLYVLGRRVGLARWTATLAGLAFSVSPLALSFHRMVYLDNIGTPFVLGAFVLALTPRRHLSSLAASGLCFAVAVLCKETFLLLAPALAWQLWRTSDRRTRAFAVSMAATVFVLTGATYILYAALKGELLPGKGHVSLVGAIEWQLGQRAASGSVLDNASRGHQTLASWLGRDPWLLGGGLVLLPIAYARRSTRAIALAFTLEGLAVLRPGYLPIPFVIGALPFAALVGAAAVDTLWQWRPGPAASPARVVERLRAGGRGALHPRPSMQARPARGRATGDRGVLSVRLAGPVLAVSIVAMSVVGAGPSWARADRGLFTAREDAPYLAAQHWVESHVPRYDRVLVDDSVWLDLVTHGFPSNQVVWFYKLGTDPGVQRRFPGGWRDFQYIVSSDTMRGAVGGRAWLGSALQHSTAVVSYGSGPLRVVIRHVDPRS